MLCTARARGGECGVASSKQFQFAGAQAVEFVAEAAPRSGGGDGEGAHEAGAGESWGLSLRGSEAGVAACSEREDRGIWTGWGDLGEVMRWGSRTYWVDVRVFWAGRGELGDLIESAIWICMRYGFGRCWGN
jgi:hypothetical protein